MTTTNWNNVATRMGLEISDANRIFASNFEYSGAPGSKYHGVSSNLRQFGPIFQRCLDPETGRMGNRSSQDMLRIAQAEEGEWDPELQWYSRFSTTTTKATRKKPTTICFLCGKAITKASDIQSEHILPFATAVKCSVISNCKNYCCACSACNNLKDNKLALPEDPDDKAQQLTPRKRGNFNDLAAGYRSIMVRTEALTAAKPRAVVIGIDARVAFVMHRILGGLVDWRALGLEDKDLLARRVEIMDKLAIWFMAQKVIKNCIVDGDLQQVNKLVEGAEDQVRAKYFALKWVDTVTGNATVTDLQVTIQQKDDQIAELRTKLAEPRRGRWFASWWGCVGRWWSGKQQRAPQSGNKQTNT